MDAQPSTSFTYQLRPFQEAEILAKGDLPSFGICWDMGLGKTAGVLTWGLRRGLRHFLVLCSDNAFSVWSKYSEDPNTPNGPDWIKAILPGCALIIQTFDTDGTERQFQWQTIDDTPRGGNVVRLDICTPDAFLRDWSDRFEVKGRKRKQVKLRPLKGYHIPHCVIFDEAKRMRNPDSYIAKCVHQFLTYYNVQHFIPMTGTPGKEPRDFFTMLCCINPKLFRSYWDFVRQYHEVIDNGFGQEVLGPLRSTLPRWYKILGHFFSVVKETDEGIAEQRPPHTRQLLPILMDPDQRKLYDDLTEELMHYVEQDEKLVIVPNEFALATRVRQVLVCPRILSPSLGVGASIKDFAEMVTPDERSVVFTPFTAAFPHFAEYLQARGFNTYELKGGMGSENRDLAISRWRSSGGVVICSTLYAQAFSLEPATRSFAIGYDWDPDNNRQAEKRLLRLTTRVPITSYYYTFRSTWDERLCSILNIKQEHINLSIPSNLRTLLRG